MVILHMHMLLFFDFNEYFCEFFLLKKKYVLEKKSKQKY